MTDKPASRWSVFKKLVIFQVKLTFDAVRDLVLSPISFCCALVDVIKNNNYEQSYFKKLMAFGVKTDMWLNLFFQHDSPTNKPSIRSESNETQYSTAENEQKNADQLFDKIEDIIREQYAKGDLPISAKNKLDGVLQKLGNQPSPSSEERKNVGK